MSQINSCSRTKNLFPSILILALFSHIFIYYYNVLTGMYPKVIWLVCVALVAMIVGYLFGIRFCVVSRRRNTVEIYCGSDYQHHIVKSRLSVWKHGRQDGLYSYCGYGNHLFLYGYRTIIIWKKSMFDPNE